jgi:hypothetical protein
MINGGEAAEAVGGLMCLSAGSCNDADASESDRASSDTITLAVTASISMGMIGTQSSEAARGELDAAAINDLSRECQSIIAKHRDLEKPRTKLKDLPLFIELRALLSSKGFCRLTDLTKVVDNPMGQAVLRELSKILIPLHIHYATYLCQDDKDKIWEDYDFYDNDVINRRGYRYPIVFASKKNKKVHAQIHRGLKHMVSCMVTDDACDDGGDVASQQTVQADGHEDALHGLGGDSDDENGSNGDDDSNGSSQYDSMKGVEQDDDQSGCGERKQRPQPTRSNVQESSIGPSEPDIQPQSKQSNVRSSTDSSSQPKRHKTANGSGSSKSMFVVIALYGFRLINTLLRKMGMFTNVVDVEDDASIDREKFSTQNKRRYSLLGPGEYREYRVDKPQPKEKLPSGDELEQMLQRVLKEFRVSTDEPVTGAAANEGRRKEFVAFVDKLIDRFTDIDDVVSTAITNWADGSTPPSQDQLKLTMIELRRQQLMKPNSPIGDLATSFCIDNIIKDNEDAAL